MAKTHATASQGNSTYRRTLGPIVALASQIYLEHHHFVTLRAFSPPTPT